MKILTEIFISLLLTNLVALSQKVTITSTADTVYRDEIFTLSISLPHGEYFAVRDPMGRLYCPLISPDSFVNVENYVVSTNKFKSNPFVFSSKTEELVFKQTGEYIFTVSDKLNANDGSSVYSKSIYFIDRIKR